MEEYKEKVKDNQTDKHNKVIYLYANDPATQHSYIAAAKEYGYDVLEMDTIIDNHFMQHIEYKGNEVTFVRVDSDTADQLVQKDEKRESVLSEKDQEKVKELFSQSVKNLGLGHVELKALSPTDHPVLITRPEFMRRMKEMQAMQGMDAGMFPDSHNVVINSNHPLISDKLLKMESEEEKAAFATYLHDLALLNQQMLKGEALTEFIQKSLTFIK